MQADLPQPAVAESDNTVPAVPAPAQAAALEAVAVAQPPQPEPEPDDPAAPPLEASPAPQPNPETAQAADADDPEAAAVPEAPAPAAAGLSPAACGAKLIELFPALFAQGAPYGPMKPMKLRIQADLQQRAPGVFSRRTLGIFFSRYTTSNAYLKALTLAPHRFDLDGQPAGEISDEHRGMAAEELARRHALAAERRAAQRPAPSPRPEAPNAAAQAAHAAHRAGASDDAAPSVSSEPRHPPQAPHRPHVQPGQWREPRRPPGLDRATSQGDRPALSARPGKPQRNDRQDRGQRGDRFERPDRNERMPPPAAAAPPVPLPVDPAQRERALLLRSYDASPLSKANFCALKGISEADLDAAVAQVHAERGRR